MGRIIFSILSLIILAIIIVMNAGTMSSFNVFGWEFEEVPIIVIAIIAFVLGAIHSFIFYITSYLARGRKEKLAMQKQQLKSQEASIKTKDASLKAREKQADSVATVSAQRAIPGHGGGEPYGGEPRPVGSGRTGAKHSSGWFRNLFGKSTSSGK